MTYQRLEVEDSPYPVPQNWNTRMRHRVRNVAYGVFFVFFVFLVHSIFFPTSTEEPSDLSPQVWEEAAVQVRDAFIHAYHGYERYAAAWPINDELKPVTNGSSNKFNGWGVTAFDSLDTMLIMDLQDEFKRAMVLVKSADFSQSISGKVPYFETVIRYLGGLLSAYALSGEGVLLDKANELAEKLDPAFHTKSGLPMFHVNTHSGISMGPEIANLAEVATLQLEYIYLAELTGKTEYYARVKNLMHVLQTADLRRTGGMLPVRWNLTSGQPYEDHLSVGARGDSAHEYLLKQYLLTAGTDKESLRMYIRATTRIISKLLYITPNRRLLYVTDVVDGENPFPSHIFEHLSCFLPGLLALGAHTLPLDNLDSHGISFSDIEGSGKYGDVGRDFKALTEYGLKKVHLWAAEGIAQTCWLTYADQPSGLGPDETVMRSVSDKRTWDTIGNQWRLKDATTLWIDALKGWKESGGRGKPPGLEKKAAVVYTEEERVTGRGRLRDYSVKKGGYLLRPETIESFYLLWKVTGDSRWRIYARKIFLAIEKETRTSSGHTSLESVETSPGLKDDDMPSYFLAETLKYLYLMFTKGDLIPLDKWVFNTEAHPLPILNWTQGVFEGRLGHT